MSITVEGELSLKRSTKVFHTSCGRLLVTVENSDGVIRLRRIFKAFALSFFHSFTAFINILPVTSLAASAGVRPISTSSAFSEFLVG